MLRLNTDFVYCLSAFVQQLILYLCSSNITNWELSYSWISLHWIVLLTKWLVNGEFNICCVYKQCEKRVDKIYIQETLHRNKTVNVTIWERCLIFSYELSVGCLSGFVVSSVMYGSSLKYLCDVPEYTKAYSDILLQTRM